ncbi:hypothetical protein THARTR1_02722 [Trichoderma harzianum]|uniref:Uncharacterized protein n=1 Tax=Trichoderma harzianum TaxID=5544 RepID=A0A2K0UHQ3_TRIHA|nr:hypothetical protein THARTR1_02722 [Trichoderma harzianum]
MVEQDPDSYHVVLATYSQINSEEDIAAMRSFDLVLLEDPGRLALFEDGGQCHSCTLKARFKPGLLPRPRPRPLQSHTDESSSTSPSTSSSKSSSTSSASSSLVFDEKNTNILA